jgi:hypothetical protein
MTERRLALALALLACACGDASGSDDEVAGDGESGSSESDSTGESESDTESTSESDTGDDDPRPDRLLVTADWRAKRLSLLDYAVIREGATTRDEALWREIDLSDREPGPMQLAITPDGTQALVAVTAGFFTGVVGNLVGAGTVPQGGSLILIELETGALIHEFDVASTALHPVIAADGTTAWTTNYGGNGTTGSTIARLDLQTGEVVLEFEAGALPHQLDFSPDESLAAYATASAGEVFVFDPADPEGTLSTGLVTSDDTAWVQLLDDGSDRAFVANSLSPSSYSVVDVVDPGMPTLIETVMITGVPYAATPIGDGRRMLMTTIELEAEAIHLFEIDLGEVGQASTIVRDLVLPAGGFPLNFVYDQADDLVIIPAPGNDVLVVVELGDESSRVIPWQDPTGPTYVVLEP